jgi:tRNA(Ile)-lysidine synthase
VFSKFNGRNERLFGEFSKFVELNSLIPSGGRVLAAVSGGIDSVVMLDLLSPLRGQSDMELALVHVNHCLRGAESDGDEKFVRSLGKKYGCKVFVHRAATQSVSKKRKLSLQDAARDLRYSFFLETLSAEGYDVIATAHNANDDAETLMLNLFRGSGIRGLRGIPMRNYNGRVIRPLLFAQRSEIAGYAKDRKLFFREDSSNATEKYARNFLRRKIIPALEQRINPSLVSTLKTATTILRQSEDFVSQETDRLRADIVAKRDGLFLLDSEKLSSLHPFLRQMIVHGMMLEIGIEPTFERITSIVRLCSNKRGSQVECGQGWVAERGINEIVVARPEVMEKFSCTMRTSGSIAYDRFSISVEKCLQFPRTFVRHSVMEEYVDGKKLHFPLTVRSWKEGDTFVPIGMKGFKKLSDFFVDEKISKDMKHSVPIVASGKDIVWVAGMRLDERFKITRDTEYAYKLQMTSLAG